MLNLEKSAQTVLNLAKDLGMSGQKSKVVFVADYSGSIEGLWLDGTMQQVLERLVPIAMTFDPSGELQMYLFDDSYAKVPGYVTKNNVTGFVKKATNGRRFGGTNYAPVINAIVTDYSTTTKARSIPRSQTIEKPSKSFWGRLFGAKTVETVNYNDNVNVRYDNEGPAELPTLVIFLTDGATSNKSGVTEAIVRASAKPIFFQFIGLNSGSADFQYLEDLDTMEGRERDNANFFELELDEITTISDQELYKRILNEYGEVYLPMIKDEGLIQ